MHESQQRRKEGFMAKIKVIRCYGQGREYANILPNTIHEVITIQNYGVTVRGVDKDVRLFPGEYQLIK